jgi:molybdenum cofactor cytidylyltransferase
MSGPRIAAVVLAAGLSSRMGSNKLLADFHSQPLIAHTVGRIASAGVETIIVVTGHQAELIEQVLANTKVQFVNNDEYVSGLASSLRTGVEAAKDYDALLVCLGDMPLVNSADLKRLISACRDEQCIVAPVRDGQLGNPVLWGRAHFKTLLSLSGDRGARSILDENRDRLTEIIVSNDGVLLDVDTQDALQQLREL